MKRIDVQNAITKYLNSNKFTIIDSLSKQYTISSYEEYVECFTLIKNTYQNNIIEFNKEGKKFIEKMNSFITMTIQSVDDGSLENYVDNNLKSELGFDYYRSVNLISIYPKSFLLQRECSQEAII